MERPIKLHLLENLKVLSVLRTNSFLNINSIKLQILISYIAAERLTVKTRGNLEKLMNNFKLSVNDLKSVLPHISLFTLCFEKRIEINLGMRRSLRIPKVWFSILTFILPLVKSQAIKTVKASP